MTGKTPREEDPPPGGEITGILQAIRSGEPDAETRLWEVVYEAVHRIASHHLARDPARSILQTTAVVHETYLRLAGPVREGFHDRGHFFRTASRAIHRILIEWSRRQNAQKRSGRRRRVVLEDSLAVSNGQSVDILDLDPALQCLARTDPRVADVVDLRFFGGLTTAEIATTLNVSRRTVVGDLAYARARLHRDLESD
jgi:RNA polymerase sigma factor (TIGR02999 family)